ncbi:MAG: MopE-related protein [Flavobacteriales bacterium]
MKRIFLSCAVLICAALSAYAQPANDICVNAITLPISSTWTASTNVGTVTDGPNPGCGGSSAIKDVWYSFVYTGGTVTIETQLGTNNDTRIAVYSACGGSVLACNDDITGSYASRIIMTCPALTIGNTYKIQAGGYNSIVGTFTIRVTATGVSGCTNPLALNYSPCAGVDDGSCTFNVLNATFTYAAAGSNCLNVQYTSTSTGNITGYNWSFPGGTPSTSTAQNPVVSYPTTGTYSATLIVSDATSATSTLTNNNIQIISGDIVTIDITPDGNPSQTSWKLFNENDVVIVQGTTNDASVCIPATCHRFEIYDSANNGMSGLGNYKIYVNGILTASGQNFGGLDIRPVNCPDGISCNQPIDADFGVNAVPFDNTWFSFTPAYSGQYRISTCGQASCDTKIWIYDYCMMANFDDSNEATFTYNDDYCGVQAESNIFLAANNTYYVRVGSTGACAGQSYGCLFEFVGTVTGCMDVYACNYNPLAGEPGPCYYTGDPNCNGLGPDLEIDLNSMFTSLVSTTLTSSNACLINEGCLQGTGTRQILRFTTRIANVGTEDYFIGVPNASNPQFEWDDCHQHYHYEGYAEYLLYNNAGQPLPYIGFKNGFCVLDLSCPTGITAQYGCGNMGITAGCADIYSSGLDCQWIDITSVPAGSYYLVVRTNWDQSPDALGNYELNYENNIAFVCVSFGRDASNNIINFTKSIANCTAATDCIGIPFGNAQPDCENNCPGIIITGDANEDGYFTVADEHVYGEAAVNGGMAATPCADLNADNEITVADAAYAANCIHYNQDLGVPPLLYEACDYDPEFLEQNENATLGVTNLNTAGQYFDIYITNADNEIKAIQFELSGAVISSVQNLLPSTTWMAHLHHETNGNAIAAFSEGNTEIPINVNPTPVLRVFYSSLSGNTVCVSNIIDILNDLHHNILVTYGDCASVIPVPVADFVVDPGTSICAGQSLDFFDLSEGSPTSWLWSFPGGTPSSSTDQNPTVDYMTAGIYTVILTATSSAGSDSETKTDYITVGTSIIWFQDLDNDGYGTAGNTAFTCVQPIGYAALSGDCDDGNATIHPGAIEVCNDVDDDCDGQVDEGFDNDNDGFTTCEGDCDDNNALRFPGAFELCNGVDEDCDGSIDEGFDQDNDGYTVCEGDCSDLNASVHPGVIEICNNIDDNCNGQVDEGFDTDNDGYTTCEGDCNDGNASINPGAVEVCNSIDDNCDGNADEGFDMDNDGYSTCEGDCDDSEIDINPDAVELCNDEDDDCDGLIDEGFDMDNDGWSTCTGDCDDGNAAINPGTLEILCNNIDDDCDGQVDEGRVDGCTNSNACNYNAAANCDNGSCTFAIAWYLNVDGDGYYAASQDACSSPGIGWTSAEPAGGGGDCNDAVPTINPGVVEECGNGMDDDCDGLTDENCCTMTADAIPTNTTCTNNVDGSIMLTVNGGTAPYSFAWSNSSTDQNISGLAANTYSVLVTDNLGCTTTANANVSNGTGTTPSAPGTISGPIGVCRNQTGVVFSVEPVADASSYQWTLPNGATGTSVSNSISLNFSSTYNTGNLAVQALNGCGSSAQSSVQVLVFLTVPSTPGAIAGGNANACPGTSKTYSISPVSNATSYLWTAPTNSSITSGQGTTQVTVSYAANFGTSGILQVRAVNCKGNSALRTLTVYGKPATPGTVTGQLSAVCGGTTQNYSVVAVNGATSYTWAASAGATITAGQGTTACSVTFPANYISGAVTVTANSDCGSSNVRTINITSVPALPASVTGQTTNLCGGGSFVFTVPAVTGAISYNWTPPAGCSIGANSGTSITLNVPANFVSGNLCYTITNACGTSSPRCNAVSSLPSTPASISGPASVCANQAGVVFSTPQVSTYTYTWTVPIGCTIVSGQGTNTISVNWSSTAGTILVKAHNACGQSSNRAKAIAIITCFGGDQQSQQQPDNELTGMQQNVKLTLYPNPADGSGINVKMSEVNDTEVYVKVLDALGRVTFTGRYAAAQNMQLQIVFEQPLQPGIYLMEVIQNGCLTTERFIVER